MGFRLRYTPDASRTYGEGKWIKSHHLSGECIAAGGCPLNVEPEKDTCPKRIADLPKRLGETDDQKAERTREAASLAAQAVVEAARKRGEAAGGSAAASSAS